MNKGEIEEFIQEMVSTRKKLIELYESIDWCNGCAYCNSRKVIEFPCNICSAIKTNQFEPMEELEWKN